MKSLRELRAQRQTRNKYVAIIRLTDEQAQKLIDKLDKETISFSAFVRKLIINDISG